MHWHGGRMWLSGTLRFRALKTWSSAFAPSAPLLSLATTIGGWTRPVQIQSSVHQRPGQIFFSYWSVRIKFRNLNFVLNDRSPIWRNTPVSTRRRSLWTCLSLQRTVVGEGLLGKIHCQHCSPPVDDYITRTMIINVFDAVMQQVLKRPNCLMARRRSGASLLWRCFHHTACQWPVHKLASAELRCWSWMANHKVRWCWRLEMGWAFHVWEQWFCLLPWGFVFGKCQCQCNQCNSHTVASAHSC